MAPAFRVESIWLMLPIKGQIDEQLNYRNMMYLTYRYSSYVDLVLLFQLNAAIVIVIPRVE